MTTFYDQQMIEMVDQAIDYLLSERGRKELLKAMEESKALADKFRAMRNVSWDALNKHFDI